LRINVTRFFIRPDQIDGDVATLEPDDAFHLERVVRARVGEGVVLLDNSGREFVARLTSLSRSRAVAEIISGSLPDTEPTVRVTIAQSLPKTADKLEWVLEHGVEAGASGFIMFRSQRSEAGRLAEKPERWAKIVKTAAEQSKRVRLPEVMAVGDLEDAMERVADYDIALFCDETERTTTLREAVADRVSRRILFFIGPEGGWSDDERAAAIAAGATPITLGPRVLRTETAALVTLAQVLFATEGG
jgi:16S rRNA (uracil1498-N3)-methyltransferase